MSLVVVNERFLIPVREYWQKQNEIEKAISNCEKALDMFKNYYLGNNFMAEDYFSLMEALKNTISELLSTSSKGQNITNQDMIDIYKKSYEYLEFVEEYYRILTNSRENHNIFDCRRKQNEIDRKNKLMTSNSVLSFISEELLNLKSNAEAKSSTKPVSEAISEFEKLDDDTKKEVIKDVFLSFIKKTNEAKDKTCICKGHTLTDPIRKKETTFEFYDPTDPLSQSGRWVDKTYDIQTCTLCGKEIKSVISMEYPRSIDFAYNMECMLSFAEKFLTGSPRKKEEK